MNTLRDTKVGVSLEGSAEHPKGHVTRSNFSCNLQHNKRCVASCKKKFTCNTPFCNCNCCLASCKKSKTTLYVSQRCKTSCLRVTSPLQLATQFCQNGPIRAYRSLAGDFKMVAVVNNEKKLSDNEKIELLKD